MRRGSIFSFQIALVKSYEVRRRQNDSLFYDRFPLNE